MCKGGNITKPLLWTQYDGRTIMPQHNSISLNYHSSWLGHTLVILLFTHPDIQGLRGRLQGPSSEYMKQLHNTLNEKHSHHARGRENLKDYQHHRCTHTKQTSHLKQTDYSQTGAGSIITTVTKHQNIIMGVNHHYIQGIQAILLLEE